jgi:hypothetical protein
LTDPCPQHLEHIVTVDNQLLHTARETVGSADVIGWFPVLTAADGKKVTT